MLDEETIEEFGARVVDAASSVAEELDNPVYTKIVTHCLSELVPHLALFPWGDEEIKTVVYADPKQSKEGMGLLMITSKSLVIAWYEVVRRELTSHVEVVERTDIQKVTYDLRKQGFLAGWRTDLSIEAGQRWTVELLDNREGIVGAAVKGALQ